MSPFTHFLESATIGENAKRTNPRPRDPDLTPPVEESLAGTRVSAVCMHTVRKSDRGSRAEQSEQRRAEHKLCSVLLTPLEWLLAKGEGM